MILFGLTGGIGMGKTTAAKLLEEMGAAVADTDEIAREVVEPGQPALDQIQAEFGPETIDPEGALNRSALAQIVFTDDPARRRLESILHPRIRATWLARVGEWRKEERMLGVVVIPLLYETNAASYFDRVICLGCSSAAQRERLLARGWSAEDIERRGRAQWPVEKKMGEADFVVWSEGSLETHAAQLRRIIKCAQAG